MRKGGGRLEREWGEGKRERGGGGGVEEEEEEEKSLRNDNKK